MSARGRDALQRRGCFSPYKLYLAAPLEGKTKSGANQNSSGAAIKSSRNGGAAEPGSERTYGYGQKSEPRQAFRNVNGRE